MNFNDFVQAILFLRANQLPNEITEIYYDQSMISF